MDKLLKGVRIDHGYVQVRIMHDGETYCKNFGPDSPIARELAEIHCSEKRKEILMGKFGIVKVVRKRFSEVSALYCRLWAQERTPEGSLEHSAENAKAMELRIKGRIDPYFGKMWFDAIKPRDVQAWRDHRMTEITGTSANREQNILGSIFSSVERWVKTEKIKGFKLPESNPCRFVQKAQTTKRERVLTDYEVTKLKNAAKELNDFSALDNISLALKSCLSLNDLIKLKFGDQVNLNRSKSGVKVLMPITVMHQPNWHNWRKRWEAIRAKAGILDIEFRDLRKTGGNMLVGDHDIKHISQYMGHASVKTTEDFYTKTQIDKMRALAEDLSRKVDAL